MPNEIEYAADMKKFTKPGSPYRKQFQHISRIWRRPIEELFGVERWFLLILSTLPLLLPAMLVRLIGGRFGYLDRKRAIEMWAVAKPVVLFGVLTFGFAQRRWAFFMTVLFLIDLYVYLLGLIFLRSVYTKPASYARSVFLLGINFLEAITAFTIFYLYTQAISRGSALVQSWGDAFYFSVVTATTIGYGDILPSTSQGRTLVVLQALSSLLFVTIILSTFISNLGSVKEGNTEKRDAKKKPLVDPKI